MKGPMIIEKIKVQIPTGPPNKNPITRAATSMTVVDAFTDR